MLTKNIREYIMILTDNREINITARQKEAIEDWIKSKEPLIEIFDADTKELLFSGKPINIKEFRKRKYDQDISSMRYVCGYGTRHNLNEVCNCEKKFKCSDWRMKNWLIENFKISYDTQITEDMQKAFLGHLNSEKPSYLFD